MLADVEEVLIKITTFKRLKTSRNVVYHYIQTINSQYNSLHKQVSIISFKVSKHKKLTTKTIQISQANGFFYFC